MNAQPQRLGRAFRAPGDENAAPLPLSKPTLHQRHKSTSTLSSMLAVGNFKTGAKRTAFGDISNTARALPTIKDDSAVGKSITVDFIKPNVTADKYHGLLKPAQRPLSHAPSKSTLNGASAPLEPLQLLVAPKSTLVENRPILPVVPKQPTAKRLPTVFKDIESVIEVSTTPAVVTSNVSAPRALLPQEMISAVSESSLATIQPQVKDVDLRAKTQSEIATSKPYTTEPEAVVHSSDTIDVATDDLVASDNYESQARVALTQFTSASYHSAPLPPLPSDPVESRELEEVESDEDYATAYSFRSRGDNTTGGATVIMAPHVSLRSRQELAEAKLIVESTRTQDDVDDEAWDTSMVAEYGDEIFAYMRDLESRMLPNPYYMDNQAEIQWSMRSVLMDWLIQVHHRFALLPETLFLCVNYIDRFLSCKVVSLGKLQLVGATAIFVAAKYEEINCPSVQEIVYMVDGGYTVEEILKAERYMLSMLQFELGWPGPMSFLRRISKADDYDLETRTLAKYFLEVTIMDERFVGSVPSYVAAGAHALSRFMLKKGDWTAAHAHYSGYTWAQLRPLVSLMMECCRNPQKHHAAVFDKYSDRRYKRAAIFVKDQLDYGFVLPIYQPSYIRPSILSPPVFADACDAQEPSHKRVVHATA